MILRAIFFAFALLSFAVLLPAEDKMKAEVYPLDLTDFESAEALGNSIVSPEGKLFADKANHRLILYDSPQKHEVLRQALAKIRTQVCHVRIQVTFEDRASANLETIQSNPAHMQAQKIKNILPSIAQQELLVMSGGKARLYIGSEIPYSEWFWNDGIQSKLWNGSGYWKEVKAQLIVEPYVIGKQIRIRLTPEFSYRFDHRTLTTAVEKLTTEIFVNDGDTIDLSGQLSDREFYSKFLVGYDQQGEKRSLRIMFKPTIENPQLPNSPTYEDPKIGQFRLR